MARSSASSTVPRHLVLALARVLTLSLTSLPLGQASPILSSFALHATAGEPDPKPAGDPQLWIYLLVAAILVLLGGAFAGLTIALMGQDEIYLQVIRDSGDGAERKHARKVLQLLQKGKHWVLVTLLLSNVITNETLPIVLDRSLGGGWPAVLGSTVLIVIFGEIAPQSVCVRYGLPIGAWMSPFVLGLMYLMSPIAWPTAKLLDWLLGEDHGTVYKKSGLKTLVTLHKSLGDSGQQLNQDEVTIITAVLDLKEKSVGSIMTPMDDVFTLSLDDVLDEKLVEEILSQGYSRIPIHHPDKNENFVGMLLVKMLITYDPEDAKPVRDFALATLPETAPATSCLDIVNFFQEGKSHMVLVSEFPGEDTGALGVVTLEDVIEELIGEEIVDESDVFIDVDKRLRRTQANRMFRLPRHYAAKANPATPIKAELVDIGESEELSQDDLQKTKTADEARVPIPGLLSPRRRSSANNSLADGKFKRGTDGKKIAPNNLASRPRATRYNTVKIKPGEPGGPKMPPRTISEGTPDIHAGIGEDAVQTAGKEASDGVVALHNTLGSPLGERRPQSANKGIQADDGDLPTNGHDDKENDDRGHLRPSNDRTETDDTIGSLHNTRSKSPFYRTKAPARSGSITENTIERNGIRKVVLEATTSGSSSGDEDDGLEQQKLGYGTGDSDKPELKLRDPNEDGEEGQESGSKKQKQRRRKNHSHKNGEDEPLLR